MEIMESDQMNTQTTEDVQLQKQYQREVWRQRIYRFFYNIWPAIYRILNGFFYLVIKIIKGGVKVAMEQFHAN